MELYCFSCNEKNIAALFPGKRRHIDRFLKFNYCHHCQPFAKNNELRHLNSLAMPEKKSKLAEIKTKPTTASVEDFINSVTDEQKRKDSFMLVEMMKDASGEEPRLWGSSIIGFGDLRIKSPATGREVDWLKIGFSPRSANLSLYLNINVKENADLLPGLGKHKRGKGCLYLNKLADADLNVLKKIIMNTLKYK